MNWYRHGNIGTTGLIFRRSPCYRVSQQHNEPLAHQGNTPTRENLLISCPALANFFISSSISWQTRSPPNSIPSYVKDRELRLATRIWRFFQGCFTGFGAMIQVELHYPIIYRL